LQAAGGARVAASAAAKSAVELEPQSLLDAGRFADVRAWMMKHYDIQSDYTLGRKSLIFAVLPCPMRCA